MNKRMGILVSAPLLSWIRARDYEYRNGFKIDPKTPNDCGTQDPAVSPDGGWEDRRADPDVRGTENADNPPPVSRPDESAMDLHKAGDQPGRGCGGGLADADTRHPCGLGELQDTRRTSSTPDLRLQEADGQTAQKEETPAGKNRKLDDNAEQPWELDRRQRRQRRRRAAGHGWVDQEGEESSSQCEDVVYGIRAR